MELCNIMRELLHIGAYVDLVQNTLVQAQVIILALLLILFLKLLCFPSVFFFQYWHDPIHFDQYLEKSQFIADINNERPMKNETYKENLVKLENLVLVKNSDVSVCIALTYLIRKVYSS